MASAADPPLARRVESADRISPDAVVTAAVAGDQHAIEWLLRHVRPLVVRYCQARLGGQQLGISVEDVTQEILLALYRALPGYEDRGNPFLSFVYGIAGHKVADARRNAARNGAIPVAEVIERASTETSPEEAALRGDAATRMDRLMRRTLPPRQHEILILRIVAGLSADEVAHVLGSTAGAIRVAQHRALAQLRKALATEPPGGQGESPVSARADRATDQRARVRVAVASE